MFHWICTRTTQVRCPSLQAIRARFFPSECTCELYFLLLGSGVHARIAKPTGAQHIRTAERHFRLNHQWCLCQRAEHCVAKALWQKLHALPAPLILRHPAEHNHSTRSTSLTTTFASWCKLKLFGLLKVKRISHMDRQGLTPRWSRILANKRVQLLFAQNTGLKQELEIDMQG